MNFLRALLSFFRRPAGGRDAYDAEVLFSGWVYLPPLFRAARDDAGTAVDDRRLPTA